MTAVIEAARRLVAIKIRPINDGLIRCQDCERSFRQVQGHFEVDGYVCPISTLAEAIDAHDSVDVRPTHDQEADDRTFIANWGGAAVKSFWPLRHQKRMVGLPVPARLKVAMQP